MWQNLCPGDGIYWESYAIIYFYKLIPAEQRGEEIFFDDRRSRKVR